MHMGEVPASEQDKSVSAPVPLPPWTTPTTLSSASASVTIKSVREEADTPVIEDHCAGYCQDEALDDIIPGVSEVRVTGRFTTHRPCSPKTRKPGGLYKGEILLAALFVGATAHGPTAWPPSEHVMRELITSR